MAQLTDNKETTPARTSMILRKSTVEQIKFIASYDRITMVSLVDDLLTGYIKDWKATHKDVKFPPGI